MFKQPDYFFEPLIKTELDLLAHSQTEKMVMKKIMLYHLCFVFLSKTKPGLRPTLAKLIKDELYNHNLLEKIAQLEPNINQELMERALSFIIAQIQTRLENATV